MSKEYYLANRDKIIRQNRNYHKNRLTDDLDYRLRYYVRNRIYCALKRGGVSKPVKPFTLLGCTINELKSHLEPQFREGMSWSNHGKWHIDHIRPCASFDLTLLDQQLICFNYKNLQPLWALDNIKKNDRYEELE